MKESIKDLMDRLEKGQKNPDRYLFVAEGEGIRWTQKRRIQQLFDFMKRHMKSQDDMIASLESQLINEKSPA